MAGDVAELGPDDAWGGPFALGAKRDIADEGLEAVAVDVVCRFGVIQGAGGGDRGEDGDGARLGVSAIARSK